MNRLPTFVLGREQQVERASERAVRQVLSSVLPLPSIAEGIAGDAAGGVAGALMAGAVEAHLIDAVAWGGAGERHLRGAVFRPREFWGGFAAALSDLKPRQEDAVPAASGFPWEVESLLAFFEVAGGEPWLGAVCFFAEPSVPWLRPHQIRTPGTPAERAVVKAGLTAVVNAADMISTVVERCRLPDGSPCPPVFLSNGLARYEEKINGSFKTVAAGNYSAGVPALLDQARRLLQMAE